MKIGIYSPYLNTLTGGEKYIFTMASCLSREHDITVFWNNRDILDLASEKFNLDLSKVRILPDIFRGRNFLIRLLKTIAYDRFIFLSDGSIPLIGSKKLFIHFQFPIELVDVSKLNYQFKKRFISKVICNSYYTKEFIDKKINCNSLVLYPPADINAESNFKKKNTILTVGRFNRLSNGSDFKKLSVMVKAFKEFQKKRLKGWEFKIVTSVRLEEENEFQKFQGGIKSNSIKVYKNASFDDIKNIYKESKVYWHAAGYGENLEKRPEWAEHFGISTVEAMSYGAVPVVINAGGQKEIVKNNDNGFLWNEIDELVDLTHKIAVDYNLWNRISERAIETSRNFSKNRFCEELNHLIW